MHLRLKLSNRYACYTIDNFNYGIEVLEIPKRFFKEKRHSQFAYHFTQVMNATPKPLLASLLLFGTDKKHNTFFPLKDKVYSSVIYQGDRSWDQNYIGEKVHNTEV